MASSWYLRVKDKTHGPVTGAQLKQLADAGKIAADTQLRQGEEGRWLRAEQVQGLLGTATASESPVPSRVSPRLARATPLPDANPPAPAARPVATAVVRAVVPAVPALAVAKAEGPRVRRRGNPLPLIAAGIGAALLLAIGGIIAVVQGMSESPDEVAMSESAPPSSTAADAAQQVPSAADNASPAERSPEEVIAAIKIWKPAISASGAQMAVQTKKLQAKFAGAWLGADTVRDIAGPELVEADQRGKYLFVRFTLTNRQTDLPLAYAGWNWSKAQQPALLVDDAGQPASLVPFDDATGARLRNVTIPAKGSVTDVVVFQLGSLDFEQLRLAIPFPSLGYYGLQIERSMLAEPGQPADVGELVAAPLTSEPIAENAAMEPPVRAAVTLPDTETGDGKIDQLLQTINDEAAVEKEPADPAAGQ